jgi:Domain of unknown function (DUF4267)
MDNAQFWSLPGVWIAALGGLLMASNALRSLFNPSAFATYLGLPLNDERDEGLLRVYGLRALFIALAVAGLLAVRDVQALTILMLAAVVMPVGDAMLTAKASAPRATVIRHVVIAAALLAAGLLLVAV